MEDSSKLIRSGYVAIAGRPNVGKSTLLNAIAEMKISIVSEKAQTTKSNTMYVHNDDVSQIIFNDTPGLHKPRNKAGEKMIHEANNAILNSDLILLMIDVTYPKITEIERNCCELAAKFEKPIILIINKVDLIKKESILPVIANYSNLYPFNEIIPISVIKNSGVDELLVNIRKLLPEGPRYYPEEVITDQTEREMAEEIIREKILQFTSEEIPHKTTVEIEKFEELNSDKEPKERSLIKILATVYCEKESHKKMIIGKNGHLMKTIGTASRIDMEKLFHSKVYLKLFVKIRKGSL